MDEVMSQVTDKLIESFVEGKISADELKARYAELREATASGEAWVMEPASPAPMVEPPSEARDEPVDHITAQSRRVKSLMDQLESKIHATRAAPSSTLDASAERVNYIAYLAKRV